MNNVNIIGNLVRDYELKYTANNKPIGSFSIAVQDGYGDNEHTSYYDVTVFGEQAKRHEQHIGKGSKVGISGSLKQDRWESNGEKRSKVKIIAMRLDYLSKAKEEASGW
jgi:single-strand DNA-binding protein